ncbi:TPA: methyltransferase [Providencia alcalifaciens]
MSLSSSYVFSHLEPGVRLIHKSVGFIFQAALRAAVKLELAEHLQSGPQTAEQIAQKIDANATMIHQILRLLATQNVFSAIDDCQFALNPDAEFLLAEHPYSMRNAVLMLTDQTLWLPSLYFSEMAQGEPVFKHIFGSSFFDYWENKANTADSFHDGMASLSRIEIPFIIAQYSFPENSVIADIGGGKGGLLVEILKNNPKTQGILFDLKAVTDKHILHGLNEDNRWTIENGSFFEKVPTADFYTLKTVTHNWNDQQLVEIFNVIRNSMKDESKILLIDYHFPHSNHLHVGKLIGLLCTNINVGADERSKEDFELLLHQAGLKVTNFIKTDCDLSILEAQII